MHRSGGYQGQPGSGGGRAWWTFPTPLGPPKIVVVPNTCYQEVVVGATGETYATPYPCGIFFPRPPASNQWPN